jgi:MerR family transcriptional regulator, thiopeptide resistance regulator
MSYTVGELAGLAGVTVRTLHHYDSIGLLCPGERSAAGYRMYTDDDIVRLHRIIFYRSLGFDLDRIAMLLGDAALNAADHLRTQHDLLTERLDRLRQMIALVERQMEAEKMGINLTPDEMFEVFGDFDPTEHADEVEQRWGNTDAFRQSQERAKRYRREDWQRIGAEAAEIERGFIDLMQRGVPADSPDARALAESHRQHISRWFYDCTPEIHRGLADMYVTDPRFAKYYEDRASGLSEYIAGAIRAEG